MLETQIKSNQYNWEYFYRTNNLARKVVDLVPNLMAKTWGKPVSVDENNKRNKKIIELITPQLERLKDLYCHGQKHANLYGGAIAIRMVDDGNYFDAPISDRDVRVVNYSRVFDWWEISPYFQFESYYNNPNFDYYNPEFYSFLLGNTEGRFLHKSRVIRFRGAFLPTQLLIANNYWEDSLLRAFLPRLLRYDNSLQNLEDIINSASVPIIKKKNFITQLGKNLQGVIDSIKTQAKSIVEGMGIKRGIMLDDDMELIFQERNTNGINTLIELLVNDLVAQSGLTRPQLLGEHPAGLQATGESEKRSEAEMIRTAQAELWGDNIRYDLKLLLAQYGIYDDRIRWEWNNGYQSVPMEECEIKLKELEIEEKTRLLTNRNVTN